MTVLDELLPLSIEMARRGLTGIWNFTNPGVISHNEVLQLYKEYIKPDFTWKVRSKPPLHSGAVRRFSAS